MDFDDDVDLRVISEIEKFWVALNQRTLYTMGILPSYTPPDKALGESIEYFHYSICADSRMKYLGENVVLIDPTILSDRNKICNAVISHLYGGRRIHTLFTGITDPKKAHLDFERILVDPDYVTSIYENADYARSHGYKFYGTTELHTSLQTAARNYCRIKYQDPERLARNTDIVEWVASWIEMGLVDRLLYKTKTLDQAFSQIITLPGIGAYYGYHLAVDCSLFHSTPYRHDEPFCVPGPGCCETLKLIFPNLTKEKKFPYGEAVVWIAENQDRLFPNLTHHPALWNIQANGKKMFPFEQDKLFPYSCEVGLCQTGIYWHLKKNPHLQERRSVGADPDLTPILLREQGNPVSPVAKVKTKIEAINNNATCLLEF